MGLFDFFKRGKKKASEAELEAKYEAALAPEALAVEVAAEAPATAAAEAPAAAEPAAEAPATSSPSTVPAPALEPVTLAAPVPVEAPVPAPIPAAPTPAPEAPKPKGFFGRLRKSLSKTRMMLNRRVAGLIGLGQKIDEDLLESLEEALIESDMGVDTTDLLMEDIRSAWKAGDIETGDDIFPFLKADLKHRLSRAGNQLLQASSGPTVILVVGINGAGKTTSIAKIARLYVRAGKKVLLAAADTFRAAAVEQLVTWSGRIGCEIVTGPAGSDPASVAFKGVERAMQERFDVLLVDTAGRLHTQKNLMDELTKIVRVIQKQLPDAPHETIMVLDATTGQNAVNQASMFKEAANVTGIFLAKLDGTAKGGAVLTIDRKVGIPVKYVGLGETFEDVQRFDPHAFVDALFDDAPLEE